MKLLKLLMNTLQENEKSLRQTGRTTRIAKIMNPEDYVIVHRKNMSFTYTELGINPQQILIASDIKQLTKVLKAFKHDRKFKIFIDNYSEYVIINNSLYDIMTEYMELDFVKESLTYKGHDKLS